jgi:hypothetical protein
MTKRKRTDNTMTKRKRTDNTMTKRKRTDNTIYKLHVCVIYIYINVKHKRKDNIELW